ncbi:MAG TPA: DoxX family protein [Bacteroidia bacterium]|nr:DoxX family protein [Bacteroidia bacterium]
MLLKVQNHLKELSLLFVRLVLSYGFYEPAKTKWQDIQSVADWFSSLNIPFPLLNAYLSASFEMLGVFLLLIGLFTRWIAIPLMFIMIVAIFTVHWENGFATSDNGFEIPLYYFVMLLVLLSYGAGKWSVDFYLKKRK